MPKRRRNNSSGGEETPTAAPRRGRTAADGDSVSHSTSKGKSLRNEGKVDDTDDQMSTSGVHSQLGELEQPPTQRQLINQRIILNVGGKRFETYMSTLRRHPKSSLAALMPDANGEIFLDRNPHIFSIVLDYLRSGWLDVPPEITTEYIEAELRHWQITGGLTHALPSDVLRLVMSYFPLSHRLSVFAQVCHSWRRIALSLKPNVHVLCTANGKLEQAEPQKDDDKGKDVDNDIPMIISRPKPKADFMSVSVSGPVDQIPLFCKASHMQQMLINYYTKINTISDNAYIHTIQGAPIFITMLNLRNSDIAADGLRPVCALEQLRILALFNCPNVTSDMLCSMKSIANLRNLDLDGCPYLTGDVDHEPSFEYLAKATNLRSLSWHNGRDGMLATSFFQAISHLKYLTRLYIETNTLDSEDSGLQHLEKLNNLQDLELDVEEFDCALEFLAVVKKLPKLRRLQCDLFYEADPEMETALVDTLGALVHLERFGTIHHCVTPRYNSKAFWERLPAMPSLKVIAAYMYNPTKSVMEALALKLTEFPVVENFRVVLECEAGEVEEERLTTAVLIRALSPLAFLKQLDLTGFYIVSDLNEVGREMIRTRIQHALPSIELTFNGSCTDPLFAEDCW